MGSLPSVREVDVASQGSTVQEADTNPEEALELFFETASESDVARRLRSEVYVTRIQVPICVPDRTATSRLPTIRKAHPTIRTRNKAHLTDG